MQFILKQNEFLINDDVYAFNSFFTHFFLSVYVLFVRLGKRHLLSILCIYTVARFHVNVM